MILLLLGLITRTQQDYGVDEETELSAADVSVLLEQCRQFIEAADNSL
jgi:hypothetical protein